MKTAANSNSLTPSFTPLGIWAFSIGTSIGWGSFIVTCNTYLLKSGILGTVFGLLIGMAVIFVIAWNVQYMIAQEPNAGGVYTFARHVGGKDLGFLTLWFVLLTYLAIFWANITSVPLFARFFLGHTFQFGFHYTIFGYEVWMGEALLSMCTVALITLLCSRSARLSNRIMVVAALAFAAGFSICAGMVFLRHESAFAYTPYYTEGSSAFAQIIRIAAISPWAFIGFENISHFSEEYDFPVKKVRRVLIWSVVLTTVLYLFVSLLSISAYPPQYANWLEYIRDMGNLEGLDAVPAFYAAQHYLGPTGVTVLMLSLFAVILTSLIGNLLALSRLLYAAGREGDAPSTFAELNASATPYRAIRAVMTISLFIPLLGRTAIGWIVDVTTLGASLIYALLSIAVFLHARSYGRTREQYTGIAGIVLMAIFVVLLLVPGLMPFDAMATESYGLFIVWSLLGLAYFRSLLLRERKGSGHHLLVWLILLMLVLFASMMWVSRATESAAYDSVQRIYEYHEHHPTDDSDEEVREERVAFLQEQAKQVSSTNTLYTLVSLGLFLLSAAILVNNYRENQRLLERLAQAEHIAYQRINALTGDFVCVYVVDPETGLYREYSATNGFEQFSLPKEGTEFFGTAREVARRLVDRRDVHRFLDSFTRESVLSHVERSGFFSLTYRLIYNDAPIFVQLKAAMVREEEGQRLIVGVSDIDAQVRQEEDYERRLAQAQRAANIDALTGVKNKHAYLAAEEELNLRIQEHLHPEFAVVLLDVNNLKSVNDNQGHKAGDQLLRTACKIICDTFSHSPVFRVGGDEFAVISQGADYQRIEELVGRMADYNAQAMRNGGVVIACGMAKNDNDASVAAVFERSDARMYENKELLKSHQAAPGGNRFARQRH